jgi:excisionase family DNA binding protein
MRMATKPTQEPLQRLAWGIREAAQLCSVSTSFIRKALDAGELRRTRLGRRVVIKDADLKKWIDETFISTT